MEIMVNGKPLEVEATLTLQQLADNLGLTGKRFALEVNRAIVPRSQLEQRHLSPGDTVEIVHAIGGG